MITYFESSGPEILSPDWGFLWFFPVPTGEFQDVSFKCVTTASFCIILIRNNTTISHSILHDLFGLYSVPRSLLKGVMKQNLQLLSLNPKSVALLNHVSRTRM
jgi:hypothetical protein